MKVKNKDQIQFKNIGTNIIMINSIIKKYNLPKNQCNKVLNQKYCDIDYDFMGFLDIYESLSKFVPKHWSIVDIDLAFPQAMGF